MSRHLCHATDCIAPVPPKYLMCSEHWYMVPKHLRDAVWAAYRRGQERGDAAITAEWHRAAAASIGFVARKESLNPTGRQLEALQYYGL